MLKLSYALVTLSMLALLTMGCSAGNPDPVTSPTNQETPAVGIDAQTSLNAATNNTSNHTLWGIWQFHFDPDTLEAAAYPIRNAAAHFNITDMVLPPACDDCLKIKINSFDQVTRILDADITLRNPYKISGYDVRGIFYTNDYGHELRNADDWTGLFDIPGGQTINPFKAFAKDQPNRVFASGADYTENYLLNIPVPPQWDKITFAVDASWPGNCKEPYEITDFWQQPIFETAGSKGLIFIDVRDWQGDVSEVALLAPQITGQESTSLEHQVGDTWSIELVNAAGAVAGQYNLTIYGKSVGSADLALWDYIELTISPYVEQKGWGKSWGSPEQDRSCCVDMDSAGNIYVYGFYSGTTDFDPGVGEEIRESNGAYDSFLCKYTPNGDFVFVKTWGGEGNDFCYANGLTISDSGELFVTGGFQKLVDFDPGPGEEFVDTGSIFLSKFDSDGNFIWVRPWGGPAGLGYCITEDSLGNLYAGGVYAGSSDFDPGIGEEWHTANGSIDSYISKFDSDGNFIWVRTWGGTDLEYTRAVTASPDGQQVYIGGGYWSLDVDFDPTEGEDWHEGSETEDAFLLCLGADGSFKWAGTWGNPSGG